MYSLIRGDSVAVGEGGIVLELLDRGAQLVHFLELGWSRSERLFEVEIGAAEEYAGVGNGCEFGEDFVGLCRPDFGTSEGLGVVVVAADGGRPLPERSRDERGDGSGEAFGDDVDFVTTASEHEGGGEAGNSGTEDEGGMRGAGFFGGRRVVGV